MVNDPWLGQKNFFDFLLYNVLICLCICAIILLFGVYYKVLMHSSITLTITQFSLREC